MCDLTVFLATYSLDFVEAGHDSWMSVFIIYLCSHVCISSASVDYLVSDRGREWSRSPADDAYVSTTRFEYFFGCCR